MHKPKLNQYGFIENDFYDRFSKLNNDSLKIVKTFSMNSKFDNQEDVKINVDFLIKIIKRCQQKNIKIVFMTTPFYTTYYNGIPTKAATQIRNLIKGFSDKYSIPYYDFSNSTRFHLKDFKNDNHLNPDGAKKFTTIIDSLLTHQIP